MLNIAVIGAGRIGRVHAENLTYRIPGARVAAIADVFLPAAQRLAEKLGVGHASADYREVLRLPEVDTVVICSATDTHTDILIDAARAGKHIFCEKPIDLNLDRIDKALAEAASAGVTLQVGFNRRFDANFRRARQAVESGEIGTPHLLHIISRDPSPPPPAYVRASGGLFVDMTIHDFDMAEFLIGSPVVEVFATAAVMVDPAIGEAGDVDTALVVLRFANGVIGTIDNSRKAVYGYDQRVEVFGSAGSVQTANNYPNSAVISTANTVWRDLPLNFFMERYAESYISEMAAFVEAVQQGKPAPVGGIEGKRAVVLGGAARRSFELNRPVRVEEIG